MNLYELTTAYRHLEAAIETAEDDALIALLEQIDGAVREKATNIAMVIMNAEATADAIRQAEKNMAARRKTLEGKAGRLREYLLSNMVATGTLLVECPHFKLSVKDCPPSVVIDDLAAIPTEYLRQPPAEPDKRKILDDLKEGVIIEGVHAERGKTLLIK